MTKRPPVSDEEQELARLTYIGATTARMLVEAGVPDPKALRALGAAGAYRRLRFHFGRRASASYLYALECALTDRAWLDLKGERMEALKAEARMIAAELDALSQR